MDYELAVIGAGPAGYSAGIYAGRSGIKTVIFDKSGGGGLAMLSPNIENYAGFESISGTELMEKMKQHASKYDDIHFYEDVKKITKSEDILNIETSEGKYIVGAILFSTGTEHRKLAAPGEITPRKRRIILCYL